MKKFVAIVLLAAFAFRPAYYVGQLAYYGLNIDYIIEKYCVNKDKPTLQCNGKCHLAEKIQAINISDTGTEEAPLRSINIIDAFIPVFSISKHSNTTFGFIPSKELKSFSQYKNNYSYLFSKENLRPPTVII